MVLVVVSLLVPAAERLRLPHTVLLASAGLGLGFLGSWLYSRRDLGLMGDAFSGLKLLEGRTDLFLPLDAEVLVSVGQKVKGCETAIARMNG